MAAGADVRLVDDVPHVQVVTPSGSVRWIGRESLSYVKLVTCPRALVCVMTSPVGKYV
jgi:hypothetical protein